jgi:hypothetical protein
LLLAFLLLSFLRPAYSQLSGSATITGTVMDPTGSSVPAADVAIRNTDTGIERKTQSSDAGVYNAPFLAPGHYEVRATKTGFAAVLRKELVLQVGQTMTVDFTLSVQAAQQEVTVSGAASLVDTEKTETSQVISDTDVANLPIAGRRWDNFVALSGNATSDGSSGLVSFRGISGIYNTETVDGANNNQSFFSEGRGRAISGVYVYSMDSLKEYQVNSNNFSAELGQAAGGVVNAVTKSGANDIHGDFFYYLRYPTWNALDPLPKSQGVYSQPIHQWQQFGASVGGPILKDKLFYFVTYDGSRKVNPVSYTSSSYNSTIRALPCPTQVSAAQCAGANNFLAGQIGTFPRATNEDVLFGKLDAQVTSRNHISSSLNWMDGKAPNAYSTAPSNNNSSLSTNGSYTYHERIFVTNWDSVLLATMVNNLRFQWGRDLETAGANAPAPYVSIASVMTYGENYALPRTAEPDEHRIQISDTLSITRGRHTFKTGLDVNIIHELMINLFNGPGQYSYTGSATAAFQNWVLDVYGINSGDGLTGRHFNNLVQVTDPITGVGKDDFYNNDFAGFFEDSWRITPKLTLNLGVRYDIQHVPQPPKPNNISPLSTLYTSKINIDRNNFAPRLGAAWNLAKDTVLRVGYGMFYAKSTDSTYYVTRVENGIYQQSFNCSPTTCPSLTFPNLIFPAPGPGFTAPFLGALTPRVTSFTPPATSQAYRGLAPDFVNPMVHEGEVTFERQLLGHLAVSAGYVISRGMHLPIFVDANLNPATGTKSYDVLSSSNQTVQTVTVPFYSQRANPSTGDIFVGYSDVNTWYNSMVLTFRRPMRHGLEFTANYTLSKAIDGGEVIGSSGTFSGTDIPVDPNNRKLEYGTSDLDQRHRFVTRVVWMPQIGGLSSHAQSLLLNGWAFSAIASVASGSAVTPFISGTPSGSPGPDGGLTGGEASNASPTAGRASWLPRNAFRTPRTADVDFRIGKQFAMGERVKLSLIGEAFNLFNRANVVGVNSTAFNYTAAGSGVCAGHTNACLAPNAPFLFPTATSSLLGGARQLQVSGRLSF